MVGSYTERCVARYLISDGSVDTSVDVKWFEIVVSGVAAASRRGQWCRLGVAGICRRRTRPVQSSTNEYVPGDRARRRDKRELSLGKMLDFGIDAGWRKNWTSGSSTGELDRRRGRVGEVDGWTRGEGARRQQRQPQVAWTMV
jgi:hypothetical protein